MSAEGIPVEELRDSIREVLDSGTDFTAFLNSELAERSRHGDELWQRMAALGWFGLATEERFGGLGLGFRELGVLYEELGRYLVALPVTATLLAAQSVSLAGSEEQKSQWLPAFAGGGLRAAVALPGSGDDVPVINPDGVVNGRVLHVPYADRVDEILLPVRHDDGGLSLALFARDSQGIRIESREVIDMTRTLAEVRLGSVSVSPERLFHLREQHVRALLDHAALALACDAIGGAGHILDRTVAYMGTRKQFGRPIGSFQALKHRAASWKIQLEGVTALTRHACDLIDSGEADGSAAASCAKFLACEAYVAIAEDSVQLHGGIGFTWDHECHLFLKRARLSCELSGSSTEHRERVAKLAFGYQRRRVP
jgi:alkylation response protein AidB-like acyl-CoA dehydrogenase